MSAETSRKARVLLVGSGGIGTIAALNLELGGLATVSCVLRSNYKSVSEGGGFTIKSVDYGAFKRWRPSAILPHVPDVAGGEVEPFDYIVCTTKNVPDIPPTLVDVIRPAVSSNSVIVLIQNGLNIEKPLLAAFPSQVVLSGVSLCGANETAPGVIEQDDRDRLSVGAFHNENVDIKVEEAAARDFVRLYSAAGKAQCTYEPDVLFVRWKKLLYNAVWNPICALTLMDTTRLRLASVTPSSEHRADGVGDPWSVVNVLVRPAMNEIRAAAFAATDGKVNLNEDLVQTMVECDPIEIYCKPSMQQDIEKGGRFIEFENILGEALREADKVGVEMPTVKVLYGLCKAVQWRTKESRGMVDADKMVRTYKGS